MRFQYNSACCAGLHVNKTSCVWPRQDMSLVLGLLAVHSFPFCNLSVLSPSDPVPSFQIIMKERAKVPCRTLAYLCSTSCCQAAGEAKKQNLQAPHGECLPLGGLLSTCPVFMELEPRSYVCIPCTHRHTGVGWSISPRWLALCILSGAHSAPVWVTAYLGAKAGGLHGMGEGLPGPNLAGCWVFCILSY